MDASAPPFLADPGLPAGRRAIMARALELFAARGLAGTTVREIAREAAVTGPALYKHFESKQALARSLEEACTRWLDETLGARVGQQKWFLDRMDGLVHGVCGILDTAPQVFAFLSSGQGRPHPEPGRDPIARIVDGVLQKGLDEQKLAAGPSLPLLAACVTGIFRETARRLDSGELERPAARWAPEVLRVLRRTLLA